MSHCYSLQFPADLGAHNSLHHLVGPGVQVCHVIVKLVDGDLPGGLLLLPEQTSCLTSYVQNETKRCLQFVFLPTFSETLPVLKKYYNHLLQMIQNPIYKIHQKTLKNDNIKKEICASSPRIV